MRTNKMKDFIVLAQEPWVARKAVRGLNNQHTKIVASASGGEPPRAMIYCHKDSRVSPCSQFQSRDVACGLWKINMPDLDQIMLLSVYWDSKMKELPKEFLECLEWCAAHAIPVHVGGDMNAHSRLWGGKSDTPRGDRIQKLMFDHNLILLNEGDIATFCIAGKSSVIDLTMTSPACIDFISSWGVIVKDNRGDGSTYNGSDHRTIETRYFTTPPKKVYRHSMKNVDWNKFRDRLSEKMRTWSIPRTLTREQLDKEVKTFNAHLTDTWKEFSTLQLVKPRDPVMNAWYTK